MENFVEFYSSALRGNLFSGFLTVGTFLFAVKTFIVVKIKEDVFETKAYQDKIDKYRKRNPDKIISHYGPLCHLAKLLFASSLSALVTAFLQITLGLWSNIYAVAICLFAAGVSCVLLFFSMLQVQGNIVIWLKELEEKEN